MYNVAYLFRRDGTWETQYKLHITPTEHRLWNMRGGHHLRVFNTDAGKIGILICYDCEFPELGRLLMDQGLQILFIPFWTETKNGYQRVRYCAQARAIENRITSYNVCYTKLLRRSASLRAAGSPSHSAAVGASPGARSGSPARRSLGCAG